MRWPANISFAAAGVTSLIAVVSIVGLDTYLVQRWVLVIALPPILGSVFQGLQYRKGQTANSFWPVAVYVFFIVASLQRALGLYVFGVILQSAGVGTGPSVTVDSGREALSTR